MCWMQEKLQSSSSIECLSVLRSKLSCFGEGWMSRLQREILQKFVRTLRKETWTNQPIFLSASLLSLKAYQCSPCNPSKTSSWDHPRSKLHKVWRKQVCPMLKQILLWFLRQMSSSESIMQRLQWTRSVYNLLPRLYSDWRTLQAWVRSWSQMQEKKFCWTVHLMLWWTLLEWKQMSTSQRTLCHFQCQRPMSDLLQWLLIDQRKLHRHCQRSILSIIQRRNQHMSKVLKQILL